MLEYDTLNHPVTVIVPMRNEEIYILGFLDCLAASKYPLNLVEVLILDGLSSDQSITLINQFQGAHPELNIKILENTKITIPNALNLGIQSAKNDIIVRMDCHADYNENYIHNSVKNLTQLSNAVGVGGVITPAGKTDTGKAIALALMSKLGNGGASYRTLLTTSPSDTIWCGCWRKDDAVKAGLFNTSLEANEDFEFNQRLKDLGQIYTCPDIQAKQYVRESYPALFQQYKRYGFWKTMVVKTHPNNAKLRQLIPVVFFTCMLLSIALSTINIWPLLALSLTYLAAITIDVAKLKKTSPRRYVKIGLAIFIMHFAWFSGVIKGLFSSSKKLKTYNI